MNKQTRPSRFLALATLFVLVLAMVRPASAHHSPTRSAAPVGSGTPSGAAAPLGVSIVKPIITRPPVPQLPHVDAPGLYSLQVTASSVTVRWYDRSDNELGFKVSRRDSSGNWQLVYQVATHTMGGSGTGSQQGGTDYSWVDTSTNISGQCYMVTAYSDQAAGDAGEQCTVRPDPSRFPQWVGGAATQWSGLSNSNDGTGELVNTNLEKNLRYGDQTWGVNLTWADSSLWRVEAQGGPHLMKGQAVAIRVWGGGGLKQGTESFGVDLQLSDTPVYEWYAIGVQGDPSEKSYAGNGLGDGGTFALWNSSAGAYLVHGYQSWGVSLNWYRVGGGSTASPTPVPTPHGVKTERVLNCGVEQHAVEIWIADQTTGAGFVDKGALGTQYGSAGCPDAASVPVTFSPVTGHHYLLVATDSSLPACDGNDPQQEACRKMTAQFDGDAGGFTRTDIVAIGTRISA